MDRLRFCGQRACLAGDIDELATVIAIEMLLSLSCPKQVQIAIAVKVKERSMPPNAAAISRRVASLSSALLNWRPKTDDEARPAAAFCADQLIARQHALVASVKVTDGMARSTNSASAPVEATASA